MTPALLAKACEAWAGLPEAKRTPEKAIEFACRLKMASPQKGLKSKTDGDIRQLIGPRLSEFCDRFLSGQQNGAILGPSGKFKTMTASLVFRNTPRTMNKNRVASLIKRYTGSAFDFALKEMTERRAIWINVPYLAEKYRSEGWGKGIPREVQLAKVVPLLILDDLGEGGKGAEEALYTIGNERSDRNLKTLITSGFNLDDLKERYGQHVMRRLTERQDKAPLVCNLFEVNNA